MQFVGSGMGGVARGIAGALFVAGVWIAGLSVASQASHLRTAAAPGASGPQPASLCGPGSVLQEVSYQACYPDCVGGLTPLGWGIPPLPPAVHEFPKFDETAAGGKLVEVRVDYQAYCELRVCVQNNDQTCVHAAGVASVVMQTQPDPLNDPLLTLPPLSLIASQHYLPALQLAPTSGAFPGPCFETNTPPGGADKHCPGNGVDYYNFLVTRHPAAQTVINGSAELSEWILGNASDQVRLHSYAWALAFVDATGLYGLAFTAHGRLSITVTYTYCTPGPALAYCFGDGSGSACPCGPSGAAGAGCANSSGSGALLAAQGSASVLADDLEFEVQGLPPGEPAVLFSGPFDAGGGQGVPFNDGLLCVGGGLARLGLRMAGGQGQAQWGPGLASTGGWLAGDTRRFQVWHRDPSASSCTGSNLSNALEVTFH